MSPSTSSPWRRAIELPRLDAAALLPLVTLSTILAGLFPRVIFGGEAFFDRDVAIVWTAQIEAFVRSIHAGSWPTWDPGVAFGRPLLANPNLQAFYPFTWLNLIVPPWRAYALYALAHLVIAGLGLHRLALWLGMSRAGALLAASVWMVSGPLLSFVSVWHHLAGAAWLPWITLAAFRAHAAPGKRSMLRLGALLALQVLAGSPDLCVLTGVVLLADVVRRLRLRPPWSAHNAALLGRLGLAYVFALGLSAAQWGPALELALEGSRGSLDRGSRTVWSLHPAALGQLLLPLSFAELPQRAGGAAAGRLFDLWSPFVASGYLGLASAVVAAAGLASAVRRPQQTFLLVLLAGSGLVALGRYFVAYDVLTWLVPPLALLRYPSKAIVVAAFAWAMLAGFGLDALQRRNGAIEPLASARALATTLVLPFAVAAAIFRSALARPLAPGVAWQAVLSWNAPAVGRAAVLAVCAALLALWLARRPGRLPGLLLTLVVAAELVIGNQALNPTAPVGRLDRRPAVMRHLERSPPSRVYVWDYVLRVPGRGRDTQGMLGLFMDVPGHPTGLARILAMQDYLYPPSAARWELRGSFDRDLLGLYPRWLDDMNLLLRAVEDTPAYVKLLQIGGVQRVIALHRDHEALRLLGTLPGVFRQPIQVFEVPDPLPRTYLVSRARTAEGPAALHALVDADFDPRLEVVVDRALTIDPASSGGTSRIIEEAPDRIRIEATSGGGIVVLLDGAERGWRASVDGRGAPVLRVNQVFRGVQVDAGRHIVEFLYRPMSLRLGLASSAIFLAAGLIVTLGSGASRARSRPAPPGRGQRVEPDEVG